MTERDLPAIGTAGVAPDLPPHLIALADHVALRLSVTPEQELRPGQVLGMAKEIGGLLSGEESHSLFGLVATHPNIEPLEDGQFTFKQDSVFTPRSEGFEASSPDSEPERDNGRHILNPRQLARILHEMRSSPETVRARADAGRLADPRGYRSRKGSSKKRQQGTYHGKKSRFGTFIAQASIG